MSVLRNALLSAILPSEMPIRTILFDLDDTLIVDEAVSREAMKEAAEFANAENGAAVDQFLRDATTEAKRLWREGPCYDYCQRIGISAMECLWGPFSGDDAETTKLREWAHDFRPAVFASALAKQLLETSSGADKIAAEFAAARRRRQRQLPNALETLATLKPLYRLGLLTNGNSSLQREKLKASGLGGVFDAVAISGEVGIGKPQAGVFQHLLNELGGTPSEAMMVGNSLKRDIQGAHNAGIEKVVWIKVPGAEEPANVTPHYTITGLHEVIPLAAAASDT